MVLGFGKKQPGIKGLPDENTGGEADALQGRYQLENWRRSQEGRATSTVELPLPAEPLEGSEPAVGEDPIDTTMRELSALSEGMGNQKVNYPITPQNRIAISEAVSLVRSARRLKVSNKYRRWVESEFLALDHEIFDRSVGTTVPPVVYGTKPWIFPSPAPGQLPGGMERAQSDNKKKAP